MWNVYQQGTANNQIILSRELDSEEFIFGMKNNRGNSSRFAISHLQEILKQHAPR
jgi:hypothetical protein